MTSDFTPNDDMSSIEDFEAALSRVILTALQNDIDPRGTWEYRAEETATDMEIMVIELAD